MATPLIGCVGRVLKVCGMVLSTNAQNELTVKTENGDASMAEGEDINMTLPPMVPTNWYSYDASLSIQLLWKYIEGIEQQIEDGKKRFKQELEIRIEDRGGLEEGRAKREYRGLDDETWDLDNVFERYFPNLQRRSALITLYSFLEHELNQLCHLFSNVENLRIGLDDISGKGILRAFLFLEKVIGLQINRQSGLWIDIKNIQLLRNRIVHQDGRLLDGKDPLRHYINSSSGLSGDTEVNILNGFLDHVLTTFDHQFQELDQFIKARV